MQSIANSAAQENVIHFNTVNDQPWTYPTHRDTDTLNSSLARLGCRVIGTATTVAEARAWEAVGGDFICAQGSEAGGHRGTFLKDFEQSSIGLMALVPQIAAAISLPVIAAGGIMNEKGIAAALMLGPLPDGHSTQAYGIILTTFCMAG